MRISIQRLIVSSTVFCFFLFCSFAASFEVVGGSGRIGSLFLRSSLNATATPRGVAPGCLSQTESPIIVATPSKSWQQVFQQTVRSRRSDLVWVGNGLLCEATQREATVVIPHFGVLAVNGNAVTNSLSPPSFVYGKHADMIKEILVAQGIRVERIHSWTDICNCAARKLLWASCMWLLCHSSSPPLTVSQVHKQKSSTLETLVLELLPALAKVTKSDTAPSLEDTIQYMQAYSTSMPKAIPSLDLAMAEVLDRNGVWLSQGYPQPLHEQMLKKVMGLEAFSKLAGTEYKDATIDWLSKDFSSQNSVALPEVDLVCYGKKNSLQCKSAVIVGGGIIGSSLALSLARFGCKVTLVDPNPIGITTPASWAWLNANQKTPLHYAWLNQLGMRGWRLDSAVRDLPTWNGALVCVENKLAPQGGYKVRGPLSRSDWKELEPAAEVSKGFVYYFEEEGCVDPCQAVERIRDSSKRLGVSILSDTSMTDLLRDHAGRICGISCQNHETGGTREIHADAVVLAAGIACSTLAKIPLLSSPGQISFARPSTSTMKLSRVLVDTIDESHLLQRKDGTLVAGGGTLVTGGSTGKVERENQGANNLGQLLLDCASELAPAALRESRWIKSESAIRPMPKDGLPVVGYVEPALYSVVTHSGITLAPILGPLAAAELVMGIDLDILHPYRPSRFSKD